MATSRNTRQVKSNVTGACRGSQVYLTGGITMYRIAALIVLTLTTLCVAQEPVHAFNDRTNLALFSADALVRTLDAQSTRMRLTDPCRCYHEDHTPTISSTSAGQYAYSLGITAGLVGLSYLAHKTGHHRIERLIPAIDIVHDGRAVAGNYTIAAPSAVTKGTTADRRR